MTTASELAAAAVGQGFRQIDAQRLEWVQPRAEIVLLVGHGEMTFEAEFTKAFKFEMRVRELRDSDYEDFWTKPEMTFDEPEFDEAILVRGKPFQVRQLLNPNVRRHLLDLRRCAVGFSLTPTHLRAVCSVDEQDAGQVVQRFCDAVAALVGGKQARGAYR